MSNVWKSRYRRCKLRHHVLSPMHYSSCSWNELRLFVCHVKYLRFPFAYEWTRKPVEASKPQSSPLRIAWFYHLKSITSINSEQKISTNFTISTQFFGWPRVGFVVSLLHNNKGVWVILLQTGSMHHLVSIELDLCSCTSCVSQCLSIL